MKPSNFHCTIIFRMVIYRIGKEEKLWFFYRSLLCIRTVRGHQMNIFDATVIHYSWKLIDQVFLYVYPKERSVYTKIYKSIGNLMSKKSLIQNKSSVIWQNWRFFRFSPLLTDLLYIYSCFNCQHEQNEAKSHIMKMLYSKLKNKMKNNCRLLCYLLMISVTILFGAVDLKFTKKQCRFEMNG